MDPVKNDFTLAFDSLNNYIDEETTPSTYKLRSPCRCQVVFRRITRLTRTIESGLLSVVAQHNGWYCSATVPFYVDTLHRAYNLLPIDNLVLKGGRNAKLIKIILKMLRWVILRRQSVTYG